MAHGGYGKGKAAAERKKPAGQWRTKVLNVDKKSKPSKPKASSLKNQIRSTERMLRKDLPNEVKEAQQKKLEELKKQQETQNRLAVERKIFLRNRKIRFFERRKIDRMIKRLDKQQLTSTGQTQEAEISDKLSKLKEDLEYVRFFPKTEKYVPLFIGGDEKEIVEKRNSLRKKIKANLVAAVASGKELEETGNEDDVLLVPSDDDFFLNGSSSDDEADDELKDKSAREQASSASGKVASGISSGERNQRQISARAPMPPPPPSSKPFSSSLKPKSGFAASSDKKSYNRAEVPLPSPSSIPFSSSLKNKSRFAASSDKKSYNRAEMPLPSPSSKPFSSLLKNKTRFSASSDKKPYNRVEMSRSSNNTSSSVDQSSFRERGPVDSITGNSNNPSSNSDVRKPRRKRRPKKKKQ